MMMKRYSWMVLWLMAATGLMADSKTYALLELRLFEGFSSSPSSQAFEVRTVGLDPQTARVRQQEEDSIRDIYHLTHVRYHSSHELWLPQLKRQAQQIHVSVRDRLLTIGFEPLTGEDDRFRMTVSQDPPAVTERKRLMETVVVLPQQKRAVLGFRDEKQRIYFISLGRGKNVELGYDRMVEGKSVRDPRLLQIIEPDYPLAALNEGSEGMVVVEGTTDFRGDVQTVQVLTGPAVLGEAVVKAVRQWVYRPFNVDGVDEPLRFLVVSHFYIRSPQTAAPPLETLMARFDHFWNEHAHSPWPDPQIKGPISKGINQRLTEVLLIEGKKTGQ